MFDEDLKALWKRGEAARPPLTNDEIERLLRPTARRSGSKLTNIAWTYLGMLVLTAILSFVNIAGYRENPRMLALQCAMAAASLLGVVLSLRLIAAMRHIDRADGPLLETLERRSAFTETRYERWLVLATAVPWMLAMAINTCIDNEGGSYRIHHPIEFALVTSVMLAITYAALRFSTSAAMREQRAVMDDLRAEAIDATPQLVTQRRRWRIWTLLGVVLLSLSVVLGVLLWLEVI